VTPVAPTIAVGYACRVDDAQLAEILKLDVDERLRIIQVIWDSIAAAPAILPLAAADRAELDRRIAEDDADPEDVMSWQQARALIKRSRPCRALSGL
jgi:putative addiction module component (TIGR02574 family)